MFIASIILNVKTLILFPLKSGWRQWYPLESLSFSFVLEILNNAIWKNNQIRRKNVKMWDMNNMYMAKRKKETVLKPLALLGEYCKVSGTSYI